MTAWMRFAAPERTEEQHQRSHAAELYMFISPYDIPDAIRGERDTQTGRMLIEFKYIDSEDSLRRVKVGDFVLRLGRRSGRLYGIEAIPKMESAEPANTPVPVSELLRHVEEVISEFAAQQEAGAPVENYRLAREFISKAGSQLAASLAPA